MVAPDDREEIISGLEPGEVYEIQIVALSKEDTAAAVSLERFIGTLEGELCTNCLMFPNLTTLKNGSELHIQIECTSLF